MKIDSFALTRTSPLRLALQTIQFRWLLSSISAARSKIFAEELGRSKVSTQILSSVTRRRMSSVGDAGVKAASSGGTTVRTEVVVALIRSESFQPNRCSLPAADAKRNDRALRLTPFKLFQGCQNKACAGGADGMTERDSTTIHVEAIFGYLTEWPVALEMVPSKVVRLDSADAGQYLSREGFVDFD